jgi:hypothetical protein
VTVVALTLTACGGSSSQDTTTSTATTTPSGEQTTTTAATEETTSTAAVEQFDAEEYFSNRTITFVVTHSVGGGTDLMARIFANNLSDLLPGNPRVEVTNVNGASGMNLVYTAPAEDLYIGATSQGSGLFEPLLDPELEFDPEAVTMFGAMRADPRSALGLGEFADAYGTLLDAQGGGDVALRAAFTVGDRSDVIAEVLLTPWVCDAFELNCDLFVVSEDSSSDQDLMMERGEVNFNINSLGSIARDHNEKLIEGTGKLYWLLDSEGVDITWPAGFDPPAVLTDILSPDKAAEFEVIRPLVTSGGIGKNYYVGPNVPEGAIEVLRQAWNDFTSDPERYAEYETLAGGGGAEGGIQLPAVSLTGQEASDIYVPAAANFVDNLDRYIPIQEDVFDRYFE